MKNKEIEELLKGMRDVSNTEGCSMNLDRYLVKLLLSYIEQLENNREKVLKIINIEKNKMGYAKYDSCLLLIEQVLKGDSDYEQR